MDKAKFDKADKINNEIMMAKGWIDRLNYFKKNPNDGRCVNGTVLWRSSDDAIIHDIELNKKITEIVTDYFNEKNQRLEKEFMQV